MSIVGAREGRLARFEFCSPVSSDLPGQQIGELAPLLPLFPAETVLFMCKRQSHGMWDSYLCWTVIAVTRSRSTVARFKAVREALCDKLQMKDSGYSKDPLLVVKAWCFGSKRTVGSWERAREPSRSYSRRWGTARKSSFVVAFSLHAV
jgi:hypothetical protein